MIITIELRVILRFFFTMCIIFFIAGCGDEKVEYIFPAEHKNMIFGHTWVADISQKDEYPQVNCNSEISEVYSQCWVGLSEGIHFPVGFKTLKLRFKVKSWNHKGSDSYCLGYVYSLVSSTEIGNHFIHNESWSENKDERRRISYTMVELPVINGAIKFGVGKQITGDCEIDVATYFEGGIR
ncbi:hypothetical protein [Aeromonas schubertii]|uniref:hypothetical protein n=1 Tax=Aeromonas schubertii TaxID=652 RepID=UPI0010A949E9|nr:hypothetical protein [Aeromonas schubertii]QCG47895.1 hypothetical protein E2P79_08595 [Aeromonas schubertii]